MNEIERLRSFFVDGDPTEEEIAAAWSRIQDAISTTDDLRLSPLPTLGGKRRRRRRVMFTSAAILLFASVLTVQLLRPEPAVASDVSKVAEATRILPDEEFGGATTIRSIRASVLGGLVLGSPPDESLVRFISNYERIERRDTSGRLQLETVYGEPIFFDEAVARAHEDQVREILRPGEATVETHSDPGRPAYADVIVEDPGELDKAVRAYLEEYGDSDVPYAYQVLTLFASYQLSATPTPLQRAAMLVVIDDLDGLTEVPFEEGAAVSITHDAHGPLQRLVFGFHPNGWLAMIESTYVNGIPEEGVPPGTVSVTWFDPPRVASDQ